MIGPMPGTLMSRLAPASCGPSTAISSETSINAPVEPAPVGSEVFDHARYARRQGIGACAEDDGQLRTKEPLALSHGDPAFQQERSGSG